MYGNLREIDIRSLLEFVESNQRTGQLLVETTQVSPHHYSASAPFDGHRKFWLLSFTRGYITYAVDNNPNSWQRLQDYLRRYHLEQHTKGLYLTNESQSISETSTAKGLKITRSTLPEYNYLWLLLEHHVVSAPQAKQILGNMVKETLFDLLNLEEGYFTFQSKTILEPELMRIEMTPVLKKVSKQLQHWKQLHPYIISPEQCPVLINNHKLQEDLTEAAYRSLALACQGELSLRRIARYLNKDLLTISQALYPYLQRGWLKLLEEEIEDENPRHHSKHQVGSSANEVIYIDEQDRLGDLLEEALTEEGYRLTRFQHPIDALRFIIQNQPRLIFCPLESSSFIWEDLGYWLQSLPTLTSPSMILFTSENPDPLRLSKAQTLGVKDFVADPVQRSDLLRVIRTEPKKKSNQI